MSDVHVVDRSLKPNALLLQQPQVSHLLLLHVSHLCKYTMVAEIGMRQISPTQLHCLTPKTPCLVQEFGTYPMQAELLSIVCSFCSTNSHWLPWQQGSVWQKFALHRSIC